MMQLKEQTKDLQQSNSAFQYLLKQREQDKKTIEENIVSNIRHRIHPVMEKMKSRRDMQGGALRP